MSILDRKLVRDLWHIRGQALAICLVIACGMATFVMSLNTLRSLEITQETYYERYRFAHVFAHLKRAPNVVADPIRAIPGVARVQTRIVVDVTLDVEGLAEPAVGRLISLPERSRPELNEVHLRQGRHLEPGRRGEVIASEAFAEAHGFEPGDRLRAVINGKYQELTIVGIALSPEYVYQIPAGDAMPDDRRFGVFWMGDDDLAAAFDMTGAFNDVSLSVMRGTSEPEVIRRLDVILEPYGGVGAYGRDDQVSNKFLSSEIKGLRGMGLVVPIIFLAVASFLLNVVLTRQVRTQREQIAALRAFGYTQIDIGLHYMKFVALVASIGVVLGIVFGAWLGRGLTEMYTQFYRFPVFFFRLDWGISVGGAAVGVLFAVAGALGAVRAAAKLPPAEAMCPEPPPDYRETIVERMGLVHFLPQAARMILRHLERRPAKALLSSVGIALGTAVLVLGFCMEDALEHLVDFQFRLLQRQDVTVSFVEPAQSSVVFDLARLPGVQRAEPFRAVPVRMRFAHRARRTAILGLGDERDLYQLLDTNAHAVGLPRGGVVLSDKLGELLGAGVGDRVVVEVLEGERPVRTLPVVGTVTEYAGTNAYMHVDAIHRLLGEGATISGAYLAVDELAAPRLYRDLKSTPRVAGVAVKEAALDSFDENIAENQRRMQAFNSMFAVVIAFGVVYNTARISLSERGRELATLRVIGFTRGEVSTILLGELAVLTLLALPLGMLIGYAFAALVVMAFESELYRIPLVVDRATYAYSAAITLVAALFSALIVRRRIDTLDLVAVLKTRE